MSDLCKSDELQKFKELALADLKVMGIVGKVCLLMYGIRSNQYMYSTNLLITYTGHKI